MIQLVTRVQIPGEHPQGSVPIYQSALCIDEQSSIGIAVECDAEFCAGFDDFFLKRFRMQRTGSEINVATVRLCC